MMRETGSGGTYVIYNNDFMLDRGMFTDIYLKLFSTVTPYWGNSVFNINLNSQTTIALLNNSLDAKGLENIKRAIQSDLSKISYASFNVRLIPVNDKLEINIDTINNYTLQIVWDFTEQQDLTIEVQNTSTGTPILSKDGFFLLTKSGQQITSK